MEIRDPVHGSIAINDLEIPIIRAPFFQRLRNIKQLGFSEYVFPGATHTRFLHSIGVMHVSDQAFNRLFKNHSPSRELKRLKQTFKFACLLHDIGHAPLSHSTESVMPRLKELEIPNRFHDGNIERQATHEDYTIKIIVDSSLTKSFEKAKKRLGVQPEHVAELVIGKSAEPEAFEIDGVDYFTLLHQLVSSELDCDRMDYLLRDSYFCGVSYGQYDLDWLLDNLEVARIENKAILGINERAVVTFDDFLLSRYHMFIMVYFHYRSVCLEQILFRYFKTSQGEYEIPGSIEKYIEHDDHFLMKILRHSTNSYAKAIVLNKIPNKIYESFHPGQDQALFDLDKKLNEMGLETIKCFSQGRLSKYYDEGNSPENVKSLTPSMQVVRKSFQSKKTELIPINEATDLFQKFSASHAVNRLHCDLEQCSEEQRKIIDQMIQSL